MTSIRSRQQLLNNLNHWIKKQKQNPSKKNQKNNNYNKQSRVCLAARQVPGSSPSPQIWYKVVPWSGCSATVIKNKSKTKILNNHIQLHHIIQLIFSETKPFGCHTGCVNFSAGASNG